MLCNLCMKDVDWTIEVKQHMREHPMTYIVTREICLNCLVEKTIQELGRMESFNKSQEKLRKLWHQEKSEKAKKEEEDG